MGHNFDKAMMRTVWLIAGLKVPSQPTPTFWGLPSPTRRTLYLSKERFHFMFKIHMQRIILISGGRGTKTHVWFLIKASYSSFLTYFQFGSNKACFVVVFRWNDMMNDLIRSSMNFKSSVHISYWSFSNSRTTEIWFLMLDTIRSRWKECLASEYVDE
jgi:hypothetical protein